ncbi:hypothetical protein [Reinekea sp. G2M2-21]|uniref:hypothetical protein n=1 Tax=Reinekea sp. G2M2-21 TaxID=2788942 RepID=UPI0018AB785E|nr:hypothetical protein [Reinekea sp. G2M2-21]
MFLFFVMDAEPTDNKKPGGIAATGFAKLTSYHYLHIPKPQQTGLLCLALGLRLQAMVIALICMS